MKSILKVGAIILVVLCLFVQCSGGNQSNSFAGTYAVDLTIMQSGHETTIVINPDGTCYFKDENSYKPGYWYPAEIGDGICFSGGSGPQRTYYMNSSKNRMYWGLDNYMNQKDGYVVRKIK